MMNNSASLQSEPSVNMDILHSGMSQIPYQHHSLDPPQSGSVGQPHNLQDNHYVDIHGGQPVEHNDTTQNTNSIGQLSSNTVRVARDMALSIPQQESCGDPHGNEPYTSSSMQTDADTVASEDLCSNNSASGRNLQNPSNLSNIDRSEDNSEVRCQFQNPSHSSTVPFKEDVVQPIHLTDGGGTPFSSNISDDIAHLRGKSFLEGQREGHIQGTGVRQKIHVSGLGEDIQINITSASKTVQVGNDNVMHVYKGAAKVEKRDRKKKVVDIKVPKRRIENSDIDQISRHLGKDWRRLGMQLGFVSGELDAFQHDFAHDGLHETIFQMLLAWQEKLGPKAILRVVVVELLAIKRPDVAMLFNMDN